MSENKMTFDALNERMLRAPFHRWLGLAMALQIVAWMASGLYFSIFPISEIRGEHLTRSPEEVSPEMLASMGSAARIVDALDGHFAPGWRRLGGPRGCA